MSAIEKLKESENPMGNLSFQVILSENPAHPIPAIAAPVVTLLSWATAHPVAPNDPVGTDVLLKASVRKDSKARGFIMN